MDMVNERDKTLKKLDIKVFGIQLKVAISTFEVRLLFTFALLRIALLLEAKRIYLHP